MQSSPLRRRTHSSWSKPTWSVSKKLGRKSARFRPLCPLPFSVQLLPLVDIPPHHPVAAPACYHIASFASRVWSGDPRCAAPRVPRSRHSRIAAAPDCGARLASQGEQCWVCLPNLGLAGLRNCSPSWFLIRNLTSGPSVAVPFGEMLRRGRKGLPPRNHPAPRHKGEAVTARHRWPSTVCLSRHHALITTPASQDQGLTVESVLSFFYYAGMVFCGLKRFSQATQMFSNVSYAPNVLTATIRPLPRLGCGQSPHPQ